MKSIITLFLMTFVWISEGQAAPHIPTPYPILKFYKYPNLSTNTKSQRQYLKDWAEKYFEIYTQEFMAKNQVSKNLFPQKVFITFSHKAIDETPDNELLYRSEFFRKQAADFMFESAKEHYPELFVEKPVASVQTVEAQTAPADNSAQIEVAQLRQQVESLQSQLAQSQQDNIDLQRRMQQMIQQQNQNAQATAADQSENGSVEESGSKSGFFQSMSGTQKVLILVFGGLLVLALFLRK